MTIANHHAAAVERVMRAWDASVEARVRDDLAQVFHPRHRRRIEAPVQRAAFEARVRDELAQVFQIVACEMAEARASVGTEPCR